MGFEITLVVIGTDNTGSYKSNYVPYDHDHDGPHENEVSIILAIMYTKAYFDKASTISRMNETL